MIFQSLASSSKGNAYIISDSSTKILLECGLSQKKLQQFSGFQLAEMDGCIVSHEHKDHSQCVDKILASGVPVYLSQGTAAALGLPEELLSMAFEMERGSQFTIGSIDVLPFQTFHDAQEPLGFVMKSRIDGDTLAFATDTVNLPYNFPGVNILAVEANFEQDVLDLCDRMPEKTRHRVANTHMEIDRLCTCLRRMDLSKCREIYLLHLSSAASRQWSFVNRVILAVPSGISVQACPMEKVV